MSTSGSVWATATSITPIYDTTYTVTGLSAGASYSFLVYDIVGRSGYEQISYSNINFVITVAPLTDSILIPIIIIIVVIIALLSVVIAMRRGKKKQGHK
ncbi:MAG: hypothetical protein QXF22_01370 [Thermoplasmata archaeon]